MSFEKLATRINRTTLNNIKCDYSSSSFNTGAITDNELIYIPIFTTKKEFMRKVIDKESFIISNKNGKIIGYKGDKILPKNLRDNLKNKTLPELLKDINKQNIDNNFNYNCLTKIVKKHDKDLKTRDKLFQYICYKTFINSGNIKYGFFRCQEFLKDFGNFCNIEFEENYLENIVDKYVYHPKEKKKQNKEKVLQKERSLKRA